MVRAFDDAEVTHVDGDVDPVRDMKTIQTELRLKDIEWTEKTLEQLKRTARSTNTNSLADKARREEIVCQSARFCVRLLMVYLIGVCRESPALSDGGGEGCTQISLE
jgi:hypothetical protein